LQDKFAAFVAQVDKSKAVVQSIMDKLNTLQVSLMQEYFG
jgi:type I restriction enzyme S subunit